MLEIIFLIWFGRKLASTATLKGHSGLWALLGVGLWLGGEFFGFLLAGLLGLPTAAGYLFALVCAGIGAGVAYGIVNSLQPTGLAAELGNDPY